MKGDSLYPVFLDLDGRRCVIVGGGRVAERKARGLRAAGGRVTVIAPHVTRALSRLARDGKIHLKRRGFTARDLDGAFVVLSAASDHELNRKVAADARRRGIPVNVADSPADCDFFLPAVMKRGALTIAVSTGGKSPALAARIRRELGERYGKEYAAFLRAAGRLRKRVLETVPAPRRAKAFRELAGAKVMRLFARGEGRAARREMERILRKYQD